MVGESAYETFDWQNHLLAAGVVPPVPHYAQNIDDPKQSEYRV